MPEPLFHIARDGHELASFNWDEVKELAEAGFLHPTDQVWFRGGEGWQPLSELLGPADKPGANWRDKVISGATAFSSVVGRRVGHLVAGVKARAAQGQDAIAQAKSIALEQFLPQFQKRAAEYLRDKPVAFARAAARNDEVTRKVFGALYDCLPRPLCRFVSEADFISFCMQHRRRLLAGTAESSSEAPHDTAVAPHDPPRT